MSGFRSFIFCFFLPFLAGAQEAKPDEAAGLTPERAFANYPKLRASRDKAGMKRCLDTLTAAAGNFELLKLLDDPSLLADFGPDQLETWLRPALGGFAADEGRDSFVEIVANFSRSGNDAAALRTAAMVCQAHHGELEPILRWIPAGKGRTELLAALLTGHPEQIVPGYPRDHLSRLSTGSLPLLEASEWQELIRLLGKEERWGIRNKENAAAALRVLTAAGSSDPHELAILTGATREDLMKLFKDEGGYFLDSKVRRGSLDEMAAAFAMGIPAGERSKELLEVLAAYRPEEAVAAAFRFHLTAFAGKPSPAVLRQALLCTDSAAALKLAQRIDGKVDSDDALVEAAAVFGAAGYAEEGWGLVKPRWTAIQKAVADKPRWIPDLLRLAREVKEEKVVRFLIEAAGKRGGEEVARAVDWLEQRKQYPKFGGPSMALQGRWYLLAPDRGKFEWSFAEVVGGELEITGQDSNGTESSLWRGELREAAGSIEFAVPAGYRYFTAKHRSPAGVVTTSASGERMGIAVELRPRKPGKTAEGPLPQLPAQSYGYSTVLAEADAEPPGMHAASAWVRGRFFYQAYLRLEALDENGRVLDSEMEQVISAENEWLPIRVQSFPNCPLSAVKRLRLSLIHPGGKPLAIAGVSMEVSQHLSSIGDDPIGRRPLPDKREQIGHLPILATWLDASHSPWLFGGSDKNGPMWLAWDPATGKTVAKAALRSQPVWVEHLGEDVLLLGQDGDLWRCRPGAALPDLVMAFPGGAPDLAVSSDLRWVAAYDEESGTMKLWELGATGGPKLRGSKEFFCAWHVIGGSGDSAELLAGVGWLHNKPPARYRLSDFAELPGNKDFPPLPLRTHDETWAIGGDGLMARLDSVEFRIYSASNEAPMKVPVLPELVAFGWTPEGKLARIDAFGDIYLSTPLAAPGK